MKGRPVEQTIVEIIDYLKAITIKDVQGGMLKESRTGTTISIPTSIRPKILPPEINPFYPTLTGNETDGLLLYMASGYVEIRHKETSNAVENIVPTSIPPESSPLSVAVGNKITCKITEDGSGRVTAAVIEKAASTWPTSTATTLKGGDNTSGTGGVKHIRLCEIVKVTDTPQVVIWHTGHIDHFCPELVENTGSTNAILKEFDATSGAWLLRTLTAGSGITITENANDIEIESDLATGWWGTVSWLFVPAGGGGSSQNLILTFEAGNLKTVSLDGTGISGTEATPGDAEIEVNF
jgi:hypothetical protein